MYIFKQMYMWAQSDMKRTRSLHKGRRKDRRQVMDTSYKRKYKANCFSSSNSVNRFFFGFGGGLVYKIYLILTV